MATETVIPADINIDERIAATAIEEAFGLQVKDLSLLGEGWDNRVYRAEIKKQTYVFRFCRRQSALDLVRREMRILPKIAPHLNLNIPNPTYSSQGCSAYPHAFYGHAFVPGVTGCGLVLSLSEYRNAAKVLGENLKKLHSLNIDDFKSKQDLLTPVFNRSDMPHCTAMFEERRKAARANFDLKPYDIFLDSVCAQAKSYKPDPENFRLIHGDLYARHLVFDENNKLTGIIDWGDSCLNDPAIDLGILYQFFPPETHIDFFEAYGDVEPESLVLARFWGAYYALTFLWYGFDRNDQDLVDMAKRTLSML